MLWFDVFLPLRLHFLKLFLFFQTAEWCSRAQQFDDMCEAVVQMFNRLSNAPNRSILYDLYNYICDIKSGVGLARAYIKTLSE